MSNLELVNNSLKKLVVISKLGEMKVVELENLANIVLEDGDKIKFFNQSEKMPISIGNFYVLQEGDNLEIYLSNGQKIALTDFYAFDNVTVEFETTYNSTVSLSSNSTFGIDLENGTTLVHAQGDQFQLLSMAEGNEYLTTALNEQFMMINAERFADASAATAGQTATDVAGGAAAGSEAGAAAAGTAGAAGAAGISTTAMLSGLGAVIGGVAAVASGGGSSGAAAVVAAAKVGAGVSTGYFVDSAVGGVDYYVDGVYKGTTGADGSFTYSGTGNIEFKIGNLILGSMNTADIPSDGMIMPQDIAGVDRTQTTNADVVKIAQLLQTLDADGDASNGITLTDETKAVLNEDQIGDSDVDLSTVNVTDIIDETELVTLAENDADFKGAIVDEDSAVLHLTDTLHSVETISVDASITGLCTDVLKDINLGEGTDVTLTDTSLNIDQLILLKEVIGSGILDVSSMTDISGSAELLSSDSTYIGATMNIVINNNATIAQLEAIKAKTSGTVSFATDKCIVDDISNFLTDDTTFVTGVDTTITGYDVQVVGATSSTALTTINGVATNVSVASLTDTADNLIASPYVGVGTDITVTDSTTVAKLGTLKTTIDTGVLTYTSITDSITNINNDLAYYSNSNNGKCINGSVDVTITDIVSISELSAIDAATTGTITIFEITDTVANIIADAETNSGAGTYIANEVVNLTDAATLEQLATVDDLTSDVVYTSITDSAENLVDEITNYGNGWITGKTITLTDGASIAQLTAIDGVTPASLVYTDILDTTANALSDGTFIVGGINVTLTDSSSVSDVNTLRPSTTGVITATISDGDMATLASLVSDANNAYTITITDSSIVATELATLAGKTSIAIDATGITTITGTASDIASVVNAGVNLPSDYAIGITETTIAASDLTILDSSTTSVLDLTNIEIMTGSSSDILAVYAAIDAGTMTNLRPDLDTTLDATSEDAAYLMGLVQASPSIFIDASSVTTIAGELSTITAVYESQTVDSVVSGLGNETVELTDTSLLGTQISAFKVDNPLTMIDGSALTEIIGSVTEVNNAISDIFPAPSSYTATISAGSELATDLTALTSTATVDASAVTAITGTATEINDAITAITNTSGITPTSFTTTLSAGAAVATDLTALANDSGLTLDASEITSITGTAAEINAAMTAMTDAGSTLPTAYTVTLAAATEVAIDVTTLAGQPGIILNASAVTELSGTIAEINAVNSAATDLANYDIVLSSSGTELATELVALDTTNGTGSINASTVTTITGTDATDVVDALTIASNPAVTITNPISVASANAIDAATTGVVTASISETDATTLAALIDTNSNNVYRATLDDVSVDATDLIALDTALTLTVDTTVVTITEDAANIGTNGVTVVTAIGLTDNAAVTITDPISVASANAIDAATTGVVTASISETDAATLATLTDANSNNVYSATLDDVSVDATDLITLDTALTLTVDAAVVTITEDAANLDATTSEITDALAIAANRAVTITGGLTIAQANAIDAATSGVVSATILYSELSNVGTLTDANINNDYSLLIENSSISATELVTANSTLTVDATAVTTITGTDATDVVAALALTDNPGVNLSNVSVSEANAIDAATTGAVSTGITEQDVATLKTLTNITDNAYIMSVADTTVSATDLDSLLSPYGYVFATSVTTITGTLSEVYTLVSTSHDLDLASNFSIEQVTGSVDATELLAVLQATTATIDVEFVNTLTGTTSELTDILTNHITQLPALDVMELIIDNTSVTAQEVIDFATFAQPLDIYDSSSTGSGRIKLDTSNATIEDSIANLNTLYDSNNSLYQNATYTTPVITDTTATAAQLLNLGMRVNTEIDTSAIVTITGTDDDLYDVYRNLESVNSDFLSDLSDEAIEVSNDSVDASKLNFLNSETTGVIDATDVITVTGTLSELQALYTAGTNSEISNLGDENIILTEAISLADISTLNALTSGTKTFDIEDTAVALDGYVDNDGPTTVTATTTDAQDLTSFVLTNIDTIAVEDGTSVTVTAAQAAKLDTHNTGAYNISDTAAAIAASSVLDGATDITVTDDATVTQATTLASATNSGTVSIAAITDTAAAIAASNDTVLGLSTGSVEASDNATVAQASLIGALSTSVLFDVEDTAAALDGYADTDGALTIYANASDGEDLTGYDLSSVIKLRITDGGTITLTVSQSEAFDDVYSTGNYSIVDSVSIILADLAGDNFSASATAVSTNDAGRVDLTLQEFSDLTNTGVTITNGFDIEDSGTNLDGYTDTDGAVNVVVVAENNEDLSLFDLTNVDSIQIDDGITASVSALQALGDISIHNGATVTLKLIDGDDISSWSLVSFDTIEIVDNATVTVSRGDASGIVKGTGSIIRIDATDGEDLRTFSSNIDEVIVPDGAHVTVSTFTVDKLVLGTNSFYTVDDSAFNANGDIIDGANANTDISGSDYDQVLTVQTGGINIIDAGSGIDNVVLGDGTGYDTVIVQDDNLNFDNATNSTATITVTDATDVSSITLSLGGHQVTLDDASIAAATDITTLASAIETAMQALFVEGISVLGSGNDLIFTDSLGRDFTDTGLEVLDGSGDSDAGKVFTDGDIGTQFSLDLSVTTHVFVTVTDAADVSSMTINIGGTDYTVNSAAIASATDSDTLATAVQDELQAAIDSNVTVISGGDRYLTIRDDSGRAITETNFEVLDGSGASDVGKNFTIYKTTDIFESIENFDPSIDMVKLPSGSIASDAILGTSTLEDVTVNGTSIGQITIVSGVVTFQDADDSTNVSIDSNDALSAALQYLHHNLTEDDIVAFDYDIDGEQGTFIFQNAGTTDIGVKLIGVDATSSNIGNAEGLSIAQATTVYNSSTFEETLPLTVYDTFSNIANPSNAQMCDSSFVSLKIKDISSLDGANLTVQEAEVLVKSTNYNSESFNILDTVDNIENADFQALNNATAITANAVDGEVLLGYDEFDNVNVTINVPDNASITVTTEQVANLSLGSGSTYALVDTGANLSTFDFGSLTSAPAYIGLWVSSETDLTEIDFTTAPYSSLTGLYVDNFNDSSEIEVFITASQAVQLGDNITIGSDDLVTIKDSISDINTQAINTSIVSNVLGEVTTTTTYDSNVSLDKLTELEVENGDDGVSISYEMTLAQLTQLDGRIYTGYDDEILLIDDSNSSYLDLDITGLNIEEIENIGFVNNGYLEVTEEQMNQVNDGKAELGVRISTDEDTFYLGDFEGDSYIVDVMADNGTQTEIGISLGDVLDTGVNDSEYNDALNAMEGVSGITNVVLLHGDSNDNVDAAGWTDSGKSFVEEADEYGPGGSYSVYLGNAGEALLISTDIDSNNIEVTP